MPIYPALSSILRISFVSITARVTTYYPLSDTNVVKKILIVKLTIINLHNQAKKH